MTAENKDPREHLLSLLNGFHVGMLVTHSDDGSLRARPMAIGDIQPDGRILFVTPAPSPKVDEVLVDPRVCIVCSERDRHVSITGRAALRHDDDEVRALWDEVWDEWFPRTGPDARFAILEVHAEEAEYWDRSGGTGLRQVFAAARKKVGGEVSEEHEKLSLGGPGPRLAHGNGGSARK
jgi:general stress protein 26